MTTLLRELQVGDPVILARLGTSHESTVLRIERVTATQVIAGGRRFMRSTGREVGSSGWQGCRITTASPDEIERVGKARLISNVKSQIRNAAALIDESALPYDVLVTIAVAMDPLRVERQERLDKQKVNP